MSITEEMAALKASAAAWRQVPEGYELVAVEDGRWRLAAGKRCRDGAGAAGPACGRLSVAEFNRDWRGTRPNGNYWAYCEQHLTSRWIEDGKVMHWILREISDEAGSAR